MELVIKRRVRWHGMRLKRENVGDVVTLRRWRLNGEPAEPLAQQKAAA